MLGFANIYYRYVEQIWHRRMFRQRYFSSVTMSSSVFQVVCETGDRLIRLAPTLALTCKELYKFRILRRLGARACCLEHVNIPTGYCDKVAITNLSMHVPSLEKSALRMSVIKWQIGVADLQEYLQHRPALPTALKELEVGFSREN